MLRSILLLFWSCLIHLTNGQAQMSSKVETVISLRSPGRVEVTQEDLLEDENIDVFEPLLEGDLLRLDIEVRKKEALEMLWKQTLSFNTKGSNFNLISFFFGHFIKKRHFGLITPTDIHIVERCEKEWATPKPENFLKLHGGCENKDCKFLPESLSYFVTKDNLFIVLDILRISNEHTEIFIGTWIVSLGGPQIDNLVVSATEAKPLLSEFGDLCPLPSNNILATNSWDIYVMRYCPQNQTNTVVYPIQSYALVSDQLQYNQAFTSVVTQYGSTPLRIMSITNSNFHLIFFEVESTLAIHESVYLDQIINNSSGETLVIKTLTADVNPLAKCNYMSLGVLGCTSLQLLPNLEAELIFTEFSVFEETLMQFSPIRIPIKNCTSLINSVNLKHFVLVQTKPDSLVLYLRKRPEIMKEFKFTGIEFLTIVDYIVEEGMNNKLNGYLLASYRDIYFNRNSQVRVSLLKITLPYFEIESFVNLENQNCDRYLNHCLNFQVDFKLDGKILTKEFYLVDSSFTALVRTTTLPSYRELIGSRQHLIDLNDYFKGLMIKPKLEFQLGWGQGREFLIGGEKGVIIGKHASYFTYTIPFPKMERISDDLVWSHVKFHSDNSISIHMFMMIETQWNYYIPKLVTIYPSIDIEPMNQNISQGLAYDITPHFFYFNRGYKVIPIDLSRWSPQTFDMLAYKEESSGDLLKPTTWQRKLILKRLGIFQNSPVNDNSINELNLLWSESLKEVKFFAGEEVSMIVAITNQSIILYDVRILLNGTFKVSEKHRANFPSLAIDTEAIISVEDILIEEYLMAVHAQVRSRIASSPNSTIHSRLYVFKLFRARQSVHIVGHIDYPSLKDGRYHVYFSSRLRKIILASFNIKAFTLTEYALDYEYLWIDSNSTSVAPFQQLGVFDMQKFGNIGKNLKHLGPHKNLDQWSSSTITNLQRNDMFSVFAVYRSPQNSPDQKNVIVFEVQKSGMMTLVHMIVITEAFVFSPTTVGTRNTDIIPMIGIVKANITTKFDLKLLYTTNRIWLNYTGVFFREDTDSVRLNLDLQDIDGREYEDSFEVYRDHRYTIQSSQKLDTNTTDILVEYNNLGLVSQLGFMCQTGMTVPNFSRTVLGFNCTNYAITLSPAFEKEHTLSVDGSQLRSNKDLDLVKIHVLGFRSLFILLSDDKLIFLRSMYDKLEYILILTIPDKRVLNISNCQRINQISKENQTEVTISMFCVKNAKYSEEQVTFPYEALVTAITKHEPKELELRLVHSWEITERVWRGVVDEDGFEMITNDLILINSKVSLPSLGTKGIIEVYARKAKNDTLRDTYRLVHSSLTDKYDNYDVVSLAITKFGTWSKEMVRDEVEFVQIKYNSKLREVVITGSKLQFDEQLLSANNTRTFWTRVPFNHLNLLQGYIFYLNDTNSLTTIIYFLICDDYIYEYQLQTYKTDSSKEPKHLLLRKYNYLGLCSERSNFKVSVSRDYLKVNCIPEDHDENPNNLLLFKRPHYGPGGYSEISSTNLPYNASHLLTQTSGYNRENSHTYLIRSDDGATRLVKTSNTNLVSQYKVNSGVKAEINRNSNKFMSETILLRVNNYFTSRTLEIHFIQNHWSTFMNFIDYMKTKKQILAYVLIYLITLIALYIMAPVRDMYRRVVRWIERIKKRRRENSSIGLLDTSLLADLLPVESASNTKKATTSLHISHFY